MLLYAFTLYRNTKGGKTIQFINGKSREIDISFRNEKKTLHKSHYWRATIVCEMMIRGYLRITK